MKKVLLLAVILAAVDFITPAIDIGDAQRGWVTIALAVASAIMAAKQAEEQKKRQEQAATQQAASGAEDSPGMDIKSVFQAANAKTGQLPNQDPEAEAYMLDQGMPAGGIQRGAPAIQPDNPVTKTMNEVVAAKNANPGAADPTGATKAVETPAFGDVGSEEFVGPMPEEKQGMFGDMTTTDKIAMAAQLGSLLRGSDRQMPAPGRGGSGGAGINMSPVFQNTIRDLYK